jgi:hypothetical protein
MSKGVVTVISDWLLAALGALASLIFPLGGVIKNNHSRSKRNERQLQGDPNDPHNNGVLDISKQNAEKLDEQGEKIDELDSKVERVLDRVESLADGDGGGRYGSGDDD